MHDLATRIRDHYESAADPVTVDEIFAAARPETTLQQAHMRPTPATAESRRRWLVAVAAATAVVVLGGGTALIFQRTGTDRLVAPVATSPPIGSVSSLATDPVDDCDAGFGTDEAVPCDEGVDITGWTLFVDGPFVSIQMQVDSDPMITDSEGWQAEFAVENDAGGFGCGVASDQASASDVESYVYDYSGLPRWGLCDASVELNDMGALITLRMDLTAASGMPPACNMLLRGGTVRDSGTASSGDNLFDHLKSVDEFGRISPEGLVLVDGFEWSVDASDPETIICN